MCMAESCDDFYVTLSDVTPVARKTHKCNECGREIQPGEKYNRYAGVLPREKTKDTWKTCAHCMRGRAWIQGQCGSWVFGMIYEDLKEHWDEDVLLRDVSLGRLILGIRRRWRKRDGSLMEVPS